MQRRPLRPTRFCHSVQCTRRPHRASCAGVDLDVDRIAYNLCRGGIVSTTNDGPPGAATIPARPYPFELDVATTALVVIDMQRDFLEPGGFGELLGNDVSLLGRVVEPVGNVLAAARAAGMLVVHTREGHRPDLADCPPAKLTRGKLAAGIGDPGPNGRILVRGEAGHDIIDELAPLDGEVVLDKPGKGAFYATDLELLLRNRGSTSLIVTGVTTEVCVHTTVREANDRGFECLVPADCVGSYFPEFHEVGLKMIAAQGGIFGWVTTSAELLTALGAALPVLATTEGA
jgi:nicotinamidase-related amidase